MEIKLFGKSLFSWNKGNMLYALAETNTKTSEYLPDFYGGWNSNNSPLIQWVDSSGATNLSGGKPENAPKPTDNPQKLTPKGVYDLNLLHDKVFKLNTDPQYVERQLESFKDKLGLIKSEEYDMRRGVAEISSIVVRFENRKKYPDVKEFFEEYPYTTTSKIDDLVKEHSYLKLGQVAQFLADMPAEAANAMKQYNKYTGKVCGKKAVFYIIADKKDFEKTQKRRDPILLAQSPFGHFWQILGAWDKEMLLVEEL